MAAGPQRRTTPVTHLGAHIVPVERALLERARELDRAPAGDAVERAPSQQHRAWLAEEFRALAAELHFWG